MSTSRTDTRTPPPVAVGDCWELVGEQGTAWEVVQMFGADSCIAAPHARLKAGHRQALVLVHTLVEGKRWRRVPHVRERVCEVA